MSIQSFDADIKKFVKDSGVEVEKVVQKITLQAWDGVTKKTPVDTGRAKANWNMAEGKIDSTVNESARRVKSFKKVSGKKDVYITNNLPYINALENGSSKQAPKGMVALTINDIRSQFK